MMLTHVSYASTFEIVPEHLIGLTQSLLAQVKDADFPSTEIKGRAIDIITRSHLMNWRGAKIAVPDFSEEAASLFELDYSRADHRQIVSNVLSAKTEIEQRAAISAAAGFRNAKAPNVPNDSGDEQWLGKALRDYHALILNKLKDIRRSATIHIGERGESLTLEWHPDTASFSMHLVSADNDDIIIHGGVNMKRTGDLLNFEVDSESGAITVLDEAKRKQIYSAVFGDWIDAKGAKWTISTSGKATDDSSAEDNGRRDRLNSLEAQLAELRNNQTYIWINTDTGEQIIQKKFKRLKEPFKYDAKKSQSLSQGKIDELTRQISDLKLLAKRLPIDKFDPTNSKSTISSKARVPVSVTVTELSGYVYEYDFAEYDGDRIFARRTLTDPRDFNVPPIKVVTELITSWSPPEWLKLKRRYHPRTDSHSLSGDKWQLLVIYDRSTERVHSIEQPYRLAQSLTRETRDKKYFIKNVEMEYGSYQRRMKTYVTALSKVGNVVSKNIISEYTEKREKSYIIRARRIRRESLQKKLATAKNLSRNEIDAISFEIEQLEYEIDALELIILSHRQNGDNFVNKRLIYANKAEALEALGTFDKSNLPRARPVIANLKVSAGGRTVLKGTYEPDPETMTLMKKMIRDFKGFLLDSDIEIKNLERNIKWAKFRRDDEVNRASVENQKVQKAYNELADAIDIESYQRVVLNTAADVAEIVIEGKSPPGMAVEALSKLGEAYFVTGMGKGVTMYNPEALFKDYGQGRDQITMHADDLYTQNAGDILTGQGARSLYAAVKETMLAAKGAQSEMMREQAEAVLRESLRHGRAKLKQELIDADLISRLVNNLSKQDEDLAKTLAQSFDLAKRKAIINQRELIRDELAKHTARRISRTGAAHAIDASMREMSKKILKTTVKGVLKETVKSKIKAGAGSVGRGLAWDALRGGVQSAIDYQSEEQWKKFLDRLFIAGIVNKQMIFTNREIAGYQGDLKEVSDKKAIYEYMLIVAREIYVQYLTDKIADKTIYKTSDVFSSKDTPVDVYLDIIGSSYGEKLSLKGDMGIVELNYMDQGTFPEKPEEAGDILEVIDREFAAEGAGVNDRKRRPNRAWHYQLPKGVELADISSTKELFLIVEVK
jgi:hypothetical protein